MSTYKKLTPGELLKPGRDNRGILLVEKIETGADFVLFAGGSVKIKNDPAAVATIKLGLEKKDNNILNKVVLTAVTSTSATKQIKISDIAKTPEFGGKGAGSGTRAEDGALSDIKAKLQNLLETEKKPFIRLVINKRVVECAGFESTFGTPKSDFHILDTKGKQVAWISHKKGTRAKDFQQYGGMIELSSMEEVTKFADDVKLKLGQLTTFPMKTAYARPVGDKNVRMKTLFGKDYKATTPDGINNIDVLYQGVLNFVKTGDKYVITSSHTVFHGQEATGDYEPYYYVRPEQAKKQFGITGARFFIVAKQTAITNKNTQLI